MTVTPTTISITHRPRQRLADTLSWWSWRLRQDAGEAVGGFVEIVAAEPPADRGALIRIGNDLQIEVPADTDVTWLRDLVAALRSC